MPAQVPARETSKYARQYANAADPQRLVQIFEDSYKIALSSRKPATAGDRYALAVEAYHQLMSMRTPSDVRRSIQEAMQNLVDSFPTRVVENEALGLREKAQKLKTPMKQLEHLYSAMEVLQRGLAEHPSSSALQNAVTEVMAEISEVDPAGDRI